jgi:hypothetical protein
MGFRPEDPWGCRPFSRDGGLKSGLGAVLAPAIVY